MPNTVRTPNADGCGARDLQKPLNSTASKPSCQAVVPSVRPAPLTLCQKHVKALLELRPGDNKALPLTMDPRRVYEITVAGTFMYWEDVLGLRRCRLGVSKADALFHTNGHDHFSEAHDRGHDWVTLGGMPLRCVLKDAVADARPDADREAHRYRVRVDGTTEPLRAKLQMLRETPDIETQGSLIVAVELLPEGTASPLAAWRRQEAKSSATVKNKLESLRHRSHCESHFLDPQFQEQYARHNLKTIQGSLKADWTREYVELMQDVPLIELAREKAPQVLEWLEARVKIVQRADRIMIGHATGPKMTAEQVRALKVRWDGIQAEDQIARTKVKAAKLLQAREELESIPLDPDLKESLSTELDQKILDIGEEDGNGKGGTTL